MSEYERLKAQRDEIIEKKATKKTADIMTSVLFWPKLNDAFFSMSTDSREELVEEIKQIVKQS